MFERVAEGKGWVDTEAEGLARQEAVGVSEGEENNKDGGMQLVGV